MPTGTSLSSRRGLGGSTAVVGGALMVVAVFLPWLNGWHGRGSVSGWDTYTVRSGFLAKFGFKEAFASGFSPMFTGLSVLIAGGLLALIGLAMLASLRGGAFRLPGAGRVGLAVLVLLIAIGGVTNLASLYATRTHPDWVTPEYGLYLLTAGAILGLVGVLVGGANGRS
jgi:hypothetical protein